VALPESPGGAVRTDSDIEEYLDHRENAEAHEETQKTASISWKKDIIEVFTLV